jgi:ubiquinone/menaquinone biosynthesis C-methylase UbiE
MAQPTRFNDNEVAEVYERLLLRRVFRPWGELLLDRIGLQHGDKVLDVATGPGTLARLAAERIGPQGRRSDSISRSSAE